MADPFLLAAAVLLTAAAAYWRYWKGRGLWRPWDPASPPYERWIVHAIGAVLAVLAAWVGTGDAVAAPVLGGLAWLSLIGGYTKWESVPWSLLRYGLPTLLIGGAWFLWSGEPELGPAFWGGAFYACGGVVLALAYGALYAVPRFVAYSIFCEAVAGATVIGWLAWLRFAGPWLAGLWSSTTG